MVVGTGKRRNTNEFEAVMRSVGEVENGKAGDCGGERVRVGIFAPTS